MITICRYSSTSQSSLSDLFHISSPICSLISFCMYVSHSSLNLYIFHSSLNLEHWILWLLPSSPSSDTWSCSTAQHHSQCTLPDGRLSPHSICKLWLMRYKSRISPDSLLANKTEGSFLMTFQQGKVEGPASVFLASSTWPFKAAPMRGIKKFHFISVHQRF